MHTHNYARIKWESHPNPRNILENNAMITRHHVALTLLCTMILCSAVVPPDPVIILVICTGASYGAMVPDIQMKKPQGFQIRTIAWITSRFTSIIFTPLICRQYHVLWKCTCDPGDKRLTHSIPGILFLLTMMAVFLLLPVFILMSSAALYLPTAFLCGVMLGMVLHLLEDSCTRKGITPLFPFSTMAISGSIRPCDTADKRIARFHLYHCSLAGIFLGFQHFDNLQPIASVPLCLFGLGSCLGLMILSSDVYISGEHTGDPAKRKRTSVGTDPRIFQWKANHSSLTLMKGVCDLNKNEQ